MSIATRVIKNTGILYARMAITVFISLYATRLILHALGVEDYGIFNVVAGSITMLTFLNNAMAAATQRFISFAEGSGDLSKVKTIFNVSIILHIIIAVLALLVLEIVGYWLFNVFLKIPSSRLDAAQIVYQYMIVSTLFTVISVPYDAVINAHENMTFVAILSILESMLKLVIAFYITYTKYDKLETYGLLTAVTVIILLIIRRIYCKNKYDECTINLSKYFSKKVLNEMTGFAGWNLLGASASMLSTFGQGPVLNSFFGPVANTAQGISNQISGQLSAFATTMLKALNPIIAKSEGAGNRILMIKASLSGVKFGFFLLLFFYIPVIIEMPFILSLWLGEVPQYAIIFCQLLLVRNLIEQLGLPLITAIQATGNIRQFQIINSLIWLFPLAISYFLFTRGWNPISMYFVFGIVSIIRVVYIVLFVSKNIGLSLSTYVTSVLSRTLICLLVSSLLSIMPLFYLSESIYRFSMVVTISLLSLIISILFFGFEKDERILVNNLVNQLIKTLYPLTKRDKSHHTN